MKKMDAKNEITTHCDFWCEIWNHNPRCAGIILGNHPSELEIWENPPKVVPERYKEIIQAKDDTLWLEQRFLRIKAKNIPGGCSGHQ